MRPRIDVVGPRIPGEGLVAGRGPRHAGADGQAVVGVLALQGDVLEHLRLLAAVGARGVAVKTADELDGLDGIIIPGGESTTIGKLAGLYGLLEPLRRRVVEGLPAFGTCAGTILLAREALAHDGTRCEQPLLGCMDTVARRNAFGRQVDSFEADIDVKGLDGGPMHAVFIRAPWIERAGADVDVLAEVDTPLGAKIVVVRQGHLLASAFHPELADDPRLHGLFLEVVQAHRDR